MGKQAYTVDGGDSSDDDLLEILARIAGFYFNLVTDALVLAQFHSNGFLWYFGLLLAFKLLARLAALLYSCKKGDGTFTLATLLYLEPIVPFFRLLISKGDGDDSQFPVRDMLETQISTVPSLFITMHANCYNPSSFNLITLLSLIGSWVSIIFQLFKYRWNMELEIESNGMRFLDLIWVSAEMVAKIVGFGVLSIYHRPRALFIMLGVELGILLLAALFMQMKRKDEGLVFSPKKLVGLPLIFFIISIGGVLFQIVSLGHFFKYLIDSDSSYDVDKMRRNTLIKALFRTAELITFAVIVSLSSSILRESALFYLFPTFYAAFGVYIVTLLCMVCYLLS